MADRNDKPALMPPSTFKLVKVLQNSATSVAANSLRRALAISIEFDWSFDLDKVERVEALWELLDGDATSHGFVLRLRDGRRCYLQYVMAPGFAEDDETGTEEEVVEDIEMLPMRDERHPHLRGGGIRWNDEVDELNRSLGLRCADA